MFCRKCGAQLAQDSAGRLCFVAEVYVPAGAGVYPYMIDQSGNYQFISCDCY